MISLERFINNIGYKKLPEKYNNSVECFFTFLKDNNVDTTYFINEEYLNKFKEIVSINDNSYEVLKSHLNNYNSNEELVLTSHFLKYLLFYFEDPSLDDIFQVPSCKLYKNNIFELYVLISIVNERVYELRKRNIPEVMIQDRLNTIRRKVEKTIEKDIDFSNYRWSTFDFYICLFNINTLTFMPYVFDNDFHIFKNMNNDVIFLAGDNEAIRKDGQLDKVNGISDYSFTTKYKEDNDYFIGNYINPNGYYTNEVKKLKKDEWVEVIKPGDYIIEMHVGSNYKFDDNIESFKQAISFFKKYYPEHNFKAIYGYSWLFSPQIKNIIDNPNSNISKMIDTGYIVPCMSGDSLAFEFIYWDSKMTVEKMPTNTSMLRNIKKYYENGGRINCGMYYFLVDDIENIYENIYKK